jgi:glycosyltransferase involved in cell wall biosynthesis
MSASRTTRVFCEAVAARGPVLITVGQYQLDQPSGANRLAYDEARFLAGQGIEVWLLVQDVIGAHSECEPDSGIHVLRYQVPQRHELDPRRIWAHQTVIQRLLQRYLPAVTAIHGHAPLQYAAACALYPAARKVLSIHSPLNMEADLNWPGGSLRNRIRRAVGLPLLKRLERQCLQYSDAISVFSAYTRSLLRQIHGALAVKRIQVIPGWIDIARFDKTCLEPNQTLIPWPNCGQRRNSAEGDPGMSAARDQLGWPRDLPVLFTLRRLVPRMGLQTLLHAAARLQHGGHRFHLMIGGDGPLRGALEENAALLNLDNVHLLGGIADSLLPVAYRACDAFVLPTAALECFGLVIVEALAAGRPVLAVPVGAIPEVLARVEPRWLASGPDEAALAKLIADFLSGKLPQHHPDELQAVAKNDYSHAKIIPLLTELLFSE